MGRSRNRKFNPNEKAHMKAGNSVTNPPRLSGEALAAARKEPSLLGAPGRHVLPLINAPPPPLPPHSPPRAPLASLRADPARSISVWKHPPRARHPPSHRAPTHLKHTAQQNRLTPPCRLRRCPRPRSPRSPPIGQPRQSRGAPIQPAEVLSLNPLRIAQRPTNEA
jgi:hypothetical protein